MFETLCCSPLSWEKKCNLWKIDGQIDGLIIVIPPRCEIDMLVIPWLRKKHVAICVEILVVLDELVCSGFGVEMLLLVVLPWFRKTWKHQWRKNIPKNLKEPCAYSITCFTVYFFQYGSIFSRTRRETSQFQNHNKRIHPKTMKNRDMCKTRRKNHKYCSIVFSIDVCIVSQSGKNKEKNKEENSPIQRIHPKVMRIPMNSHKKCHMFCPIEDDNSWLFKTKEEGQFTPRRKNNDQTITLSIYFFYSWGKWRYLYFMFGSLKLWLMGIYIYIYKGIVMVFSDSFGMWMSSSVFFLMFLGILWWNVMHILMDFHGSWGLTIKSNIDGNTNREKHGEHQVWVWWTKSGFCGMVVNYNL